VRLVQSLHRGIYGSSGTVYCAEGSGPDGFLWGSTVERYLDEHVGAHCAAELAGSERELGVVGDYAHGKNSLHGMCRTNAYSVFRAGRFCEVHSVRRRSVAVVDASRSKEASRRPILRCVFCARYS
jgi:hypothetical protein